MPADRDSRAREPAPDPPKGSPAHLRRAILRRIPGMRRAYHRWRQAALEARRRAGSRRYRDALAWLRGAAAAIARRRREERLTVGVEIDALWEPLTGIGWYLYRLLDELADRDDVRLRLYPPTLVPSPDLPGPRVDLPRGRAVEIVEYRAPAELPLPADSTIHALRRLEPVLIGLDANDVLFAPNFFLSRRFHLARGARVATVHDLAFQRFSWTLDRRTLRDLTDRFQHAVLESARLITVSAAVRDELVARGYADPGRVRAIHHGPGQLAGIDPGELPAGLPARFALHVGTLEPRKDVGTLLAAWRHLAERLADPPQLVLCGRIGWKAAPLRRRIEEAASAGWLRHLGYVDERRLAALYRAATVVVFPSLYEGFGLPAVEALWAGVPLVASDLPVLREVTAGAALFVPPGRPQLLADAVARLLGDPELAARLVAAGRRRAAALSWERAARETLEVWRQAAGA